MSAPDYSVFEQDAAEVRQTTQARVGIVKDLLDQRKDLMDDILSKETELKNLKTALEQLETKEIPQAMKDAGLPQFTTSDGLDISIKREVYCGITEANKYDAHKWLRDHDFGGIIKNVVSFSFGKGEDEKAKELLESAELLGYNNHEQKESVHGQTLKKFVKDALDTGIEVPRELFGVYDVERVEVKAAKPSKKR